MLYKHHIAYKSPPPWVSMVTIDGSVLFRTQPIRGCGSFCSLPPSLTCSRAGLVCGAPRSRSRNSIRDGERFERVSVWKVAAHAQCRLLERELRAPCVKLRSYTQARAHTHIQPHKARARWKRERMSLHFERIQSA